MRGCGDPIPLLPDRAAPQGSRGRAAASVCPPGSTAPGVGHMGTGPWASATLPPGAPGAQRVHSRTDAPKHQLRLTDKAHRTGSGKGYLCFWQMKGVLFSGGWAGGGGPRKVNPLFLVFRTRKMGLGVSLGESAAPWNRVRGRGCVLGPVRMEEDLPTDVLNSWQPPDLPSQLVSGHPEHHGGSWPRLRTHDSKPASLVHRG